MKKILLIFTLLIVFHKANAGSMIPRDTTKKASIVGLPVAYFSPETNWAFGLGAIYTFRIKEEVRPSSLQIGLIYTLRKQFLFYLPFQFYWDKTKYDVNGELGFYKYNYQYFGIGNRDTISNGEIYDVTYPRIRLHILRKIFKDGYLGLDYAMDDYNVTQIVQHGILDNENPVGKTGGLMSSIGIRFKLDSRDNIFYTQKGQFLRCFLVTNPKIFGSPFKFSKFGVDYRFFYTNRFQHTLGFQFKSEVTLGAKIPFFRMSELGGNKMMRGYIEGEYRDKFFFGMQSEYRLPLFWRLGLVGFLGVGTVADQISNLKSKYIKWSIGTGLRILLNKKEHINMRIDAAWGSRQQSPRFYVTFGEAF